MARNERDRKPWEAPRHLVITGASSGIGAALARVYAAQDAQLSLSGRNTARLKEVATQCRAKGAEVAADTIDVTERLEMADWIASRDMARPIDLVIANAGISAGTGAPGGESEVQAREIYRVNVEGVMHTVLPTLAPMRARGRGQIAIMSSLAAFRGFPGAPAYCASKAMVKVWGEALRGCLAAEGIAVSVICPGFVESPMTAVNDFPMPFMISSAKAAEIIRKGLSRNRARIAFPWPTYFLAWSLGAMPPGVVDPLLRRLPAKG